MAQRTIEVTTRRPVGDGTAKSSGMVEEITGKLSVAAVFALCCSFVFLVFRGSALPVRASATTLSGVRNRSLPSRSPVGVR